MRVALCVLSVLVLSVPALADEAKLSPKAAWNKMQQEINDLRQMRDWQAMRKVQQDRPKEFLKAWDEGSNKAAGEELFYLAHFLNSAQRPVEAMSGYRTSANDEKLPMVLRRQAMAAFARAMTSAMYGNKLAAADADEAIEQATKYRDSLTGDETKSFRVGINRSLGTGHELRERGEAAVDCFMRAAREQPMLAYSLGRNVIAAIMGTNTDLKAYDGMRARGAAAKKELIELYAGYVKQLQDSNSPRAARAAGSLERMETMTMPLEMLGKPAPAWTLEHKFSGVETLADVAGKVTLVDFWATWCPWCIRSFPAIRDLLRDYKDKPFTVLGITAKHAYVWESRYELDDDFKAKAPESGRTPVTLQLQRGADEAAKAAHHAKEKEIIATFMKNHAMTWPVVMIDAAEPAAKWALTGWPHAVVLDKQGRVRAFKRGALLRDRTEQVKKFRKLVERLMAE